jgi:hypothetical protein
MRPFSVLYRKNRLILSKLLTGLIINKGSQLNPWMQQTLQKNKTELIVIALKGNLL